MKKPIVTHELIILETGDIALRSKVRIEGDWHNHQVMLQKITDLSDLKYYMKLNLQALRCYIGDVFVGSSL